MQFPHQLEVITPTQVTDAYGNPTPQLEYGSDAPRRPVWGLLQPGSSTEPASPGRAPVVTSWRLYTQSAIAARERVVWQRRVFEVSGEPSWWSPRFGHVHYEARLTHVQG
ncbi:phage head completion protein [Amycolatopsis vastitatis]|uniref:Head-tail adaptor protein n=1 Tax=Amycolatopsis vastitatis TaxID=1905142 RepID=A0A229SWD3_9PSEU|nr:hypothetical protein [Amycolatopsis vastitatis]OXM63142.1 hypothetical protein CF165_32825 [Amycolatopsis vastitatis]